jgi:hypothetical protein
MFEKDIAQDDFSPLLSPAALGILFHIFTSYGKVATTQDLLDYFVDESQEINEAIDELRWRSFLNVTFAYIGDIETPIWEVTSAGTRYISVYTQALSDKYGIDFNE